MGVSQAGGIMLYAKSHDGEKARAAPGNHALCPHCGSEMVPKCGSIYIWHWSHRAIARCDPWREGETDWHLYWKSLLPPAQVEVTMAKGGIRHCADMLTSKGTVVELQHSYIAPAKIKEREKFYDRMIWLFDIRDCAEHGEPRFDVRENEGYWTFRWKHPRKHIATTTCKTFLDLGDDCIFYLKKIYLNKRCGGWGYLYTYKEFINRWIR